MKIVLHAFGDKLRGVMEVPEDTGMTFRLAMTQPISVKTIDNKDYPLMDSPINTLATFEWTGKVYMKTGHEYDGARIYQLTNLSK